MKRAFSDKNGDYLAAPEDEAASKPGVEMRNQISVAYKNRVAARRTAFSAGRSEVAGETERVTAVAVAAVSRRHGAWSRGGPGPRESKGRCVSTHGALPGG